MENFENQFKAFIEQTMQTDAAHDINHVLRVVRTAKQLCQDEKARPEIVVPAAYLHDCFTYPKDHPERKSSAFLAADKAIEFLDNINYSPEYFEAIHHAIITHSFSANVTPQTLEAEIVQDADRLDALGAIGIARCIQVSATFDTTFYSVDDPFCDLRKPDDETYTVDHFYSKLFKLADTMKTSSGRHEAKKRTEFMCRYLEQLSTEI